MTEKTNRGPERNRSMFPIKLHGLLCDAERNGHDDIISWLPDGRSFKVHDRERFAQVIMPKYFGSSKYRSFQKSLNMWNFTSIRRRSSGGKAPDANNEVFAKGACFHPYFVREAPLLSLRMMRQPVLQKSKKKAPEENYSLQVEPERSGSCQYLTQAAAWPWENRVRGPLACAEEIANAPRSTVQPEERLNGASLSSPVLPQVTPSVMLQNVSAQSDLHLAASQFLNNPTTESLEDRRLLRLATAGLVSSSSPFSLSDGIRMGIGTNESLLNLHKIQATRHCSDLNRMGCAPLGSEIDHAVAALCSARKFRTNQA